MSKKAVQADLETNQIRSNMQKIMEEVEEQKFQNQLFTEKYEETLAQSEKLNEENKVLATIIIKLKQKLGDLDISLRKSQNSARFSERGSPGSEDNKNCEQEHLTEFQTILSPKNNQHENLNNLRPPSPLRHTLLQK